MPTPVGHVLGGIMCLFFNKEFVLKNWPVLCLVVFYALLPDIDFLFGLVEGLPNKYHHQSTHSFVFIVLAGLLGGFIVNKLKIMQFTKSFVLFTVSGASHLLLDVLALDTKAPFGAPLFWPFSNKFFISPVTIFSDVHRSSSSHTFWASLLSSHNFETVLIEIAILLPIVILLFFVGKNKTNG